MYSEGLVSLRSTHGSESDEHVGTLSDMQHCAEPLLNGTLDSPPYHGLSVVPMALTYYGVPRAPDRSQRS